MYVGIFIVWQQHNGTLRDTAKKANKNQFLLKIKTHTHTVTAIEIRWRAWKTTTQQQQDTVEEQQQHIISDATPTSKPASTSTFSPVARFKGQQQFSFSICFNFFSHTHTNTDATAFNSFQVLLLWIANCNWCLRLYISVRPRVAICAMQFALLTVKSERVTVRQQWGWRGNGSARA